MAATGEANVVGAGFVVNGLYRLERMLGEGGMGQVWEARHERTRGRVAVKILLAALGGDESVLARFRREAELTSDLNHPNIVRVSDFDRLPDGRPYIVMEFLEGNDLATELARRGALPAEEAAEIIEQTAIGLHAAHERGIVHRDLKPANLFMVPLAGSSRFVVKILDFGISKAADGAAGLTKTQTVIGTPHYMAPEQAMAVGAALDARADQFALAAIAYELFTGRQAFSAPHILGVLYSVVNERPPAFVATGIAELSDVEAVVMRGLEKAPGDRYASVLAFSRALREAVRSRPRDKPTASVTEILPVQPAPTPVVAGATKVLPVVGALAGRDTGVEPEARARPPGRARRPVVIAALVAVVAVALAWVAVRLLSKSDDDAGGDARPRLAPTTPVPTPAQTKAPATAPAPSAEAVPPVVETAPPPQAPSVASSAQNADSTKDAVQVTPKPSKSGGTKAPAAKPRRPKTPLNESL